jgi:hypothetical protein
MTLSHSVLCNYPSFCYPTELFYPLPDASDLPHSETYVFYISENNFGPSNEIIVSTGYIIIIIIIIIIIMCYYSALTSRN